MSNNITAIRMKMDSGDVRRSERRGSHWWWIGEPANVPSAEALARQNRHEFERWALGKVYARPAREKVKGADGY